MIILLTAARFCKPPTHEMILQELSTILMSAKACARRLLHNRLSTVANRVLASGCTPLALLRPIFLHLEDLLKLQPRVIQILLAEADRYSPSPVLPTWSGDADPQLRLDFRRSLKQHLYGCNILHSARLKLAVAEFCWASRLFSLLFLVQMAFSQRHTSDFSKQEEYGQVAQQLLRTISFIVLKIMCRHVSAVATCVKGNSYAWFYSNFNTTTIRKRRAIFNADRLTSIVAQRTNRSPL